MKVILVKFGLGCDGMPPTGFSTMA